MTLSPTIGRDRFRDVVPICSAQRLPSQIEVLSADPQIVAADDSDAAWQLEALFPSISRVEQDHVDPLLEAGLVRVAEDYDMGLLPPEHRRGYGMTLHRTGTGSKRKRLGYDARQKMALRGQAGAEQSPRNSG